MARVSHPLTIHFKTEYDKDLFDEAMRALKDIQFNGDDSEHVPPFSTAAQTALWARMTIERVVQTGIFRDQDDDFEKFVPLEERI